VSKVIEAAQRCVAAARRVGDLLNQQAQIRIELGKAKDDLAQAKDALNELIDGELERTL
jgi:hypothetical protein